MTPDTLRALIERVEQGPSREVDAEIEAWLTGWVPSHLCSDRTRQSYSPGKLHRLDDGSNLLLRDVKTAPNYTTGGLDLTGAASLVPEGFCGQTQRCVWRYDSALIWAEVFDLTESPIYVAGSSDDPTVSRAKSLAHALTLAALRAQLAMMEG